MLNIMLEWEVQDQKRIKGKSGSEEAAPSSACQTDVQSNTLLYLPHEMAHYTETLLKLDWMVFSSYDNIVSMAPTESRGRGKSSLHLVYLYVRLNVSIIC